MVPQTKAGIEAIGRILDEEGIVHTPAQSERVFVAVMRAVGYLEMLEALDAADILAGVAMAEPKTGDEEGWEDRLVRAAHVYQRRQIR